MTQYQTVLDGEIQLRDGTIKLHGPAAFEGMRQAGRLAAEILDELASQVAPGVPTGALDDLVRTMTLDGGAWDYNDNAVEVFNAQPWRRRSLRARAMIWRLSPMAITGSLFRA